jgi:hypothetical protein
MKTAAKPAVNRVTPASTGAPAKVEIGPDQVGHRPDSRVPGKDARDRAPPTRPAPPAASARAVRRRRHQPLPRPPRTDALSSSCCIALRITTAIRPTPSMISVAGSCSRTWRNLGQPSGGLSAQVPGWPSKAIALSFRRADAHESSASAFVFSRSSASTRRAHQLVTAVTLRGGGHGCRPRAAGDNGCGHTVGGCTTTWPHPCAVQPVSAGDAARRGEKAFHGPSCPRRLRYVIGRASSSKWTT